MKKTSNPILFFGSGPVAAASLELLNNDFAFEAVITKPRPAHHKGDVPVLTAASKLGLPVFTAKNKIELDELFRSKKFQASLAILIDFGIIVSQEVIDAFPLGIVNSHFSLLPKLRGADPITFSILEGEGKTGISLMLLVKAMDEGPLLAQKAFKMPGDMTTPKLTKKLIQLSYEALKATIPAYISGTVQPHPQPDEPASYSRRLTKDDGLLDWEKPAVQLEREIRAFIEWPKSRAVLGNTEIIVTKACAVSGDGKPGQTDIKDGLPLVYCRQGALVLDTVKPAGKKEMPGKAFLTGYKANFLSS
ncbi:MAG TPA: methionyl-tRNA formyltransferase [Candidatus Saccharimonadales bacterium]|nr:methionyl-tRNA formyltransferase [Candidatus Saccharimonadales bacterium]